MGVRMVCHCLWAGALLQWVMAAPGLAQDDDPFGAGEGTPVATETPTEDPLAAPFVCVLWASPQVREDPWGALQGYLDAEPDEPRLVPRETPAGVHYTSKARQPLVPVPAETIGLKHRKATERVLPLLESLTDDARQSLCAGEWVDLTPLRESVLNAYSEADSGAKTAREAVARAVRILGRLDIYPAIVTRQLPTDGGAYASSRLYGSAPPPGSVQIDAAGRVLWPALLSPIEGVRLNEWERMVVEREESVAVGSVASCRLHDALARSGGTVRLDSLHGRCVSEVVAEAEKASGERMLLSDEFGGLLVLARGGEVRWADVVEALVASAWAAPRRDEQVGDDVWTIRAGDPNAALSAALAREALRAPVPELSDRVDSIVCECFTRRAEVLNTLPIQPQLFRTRWCGRLSDFPAADRAALDALLTPPPPRCVQTSGANPEPARSLLVHWHDTGENPIVELRMTYDLLLLACVEYGHVDRATGEWAPQPVPDALYERGARRDLPVYSCVPTGFTFY